MTYHDDFTLSAALLDQLSTQGLGALPDLFPVLLNAAMQIERQKHLGAAPQERTQERTGHANGYKDKTLNTRLGQITVMYVQGVSTRKVAAITEQLLSRSSFADLPFRQPKYVRPPSSSTRRLRPGGSGLFRPARMSISMPVMSGCARTG